MDNSDNLERLARALTERITRFINDDPCSYQLIRQSYLNGADAFDLHMELVEMFQGAPYESRLTEADKEIFRQLKIQP